MPQKCPECRSAKAAEIVYGYPSSDWDWEKDVDSGKVVIGRVLHSSGSAQFAMPVLRPRMGRCKRSGLAVAALGF